MNMKERLMARNEGYNHTYMGILIYIYILHWICKQCSPSKWIAKGKKTSSNHANEISCADYDPAIACMASGKEKKTEQIRNEHDIGHDLKRYYKMFPVLIELSPLTQIVLYSMNNS